MRCCWCCGGKSNKSGREELARSSALVVALPLPCAAVPATRPTAGVDADAVMVAGEGGGFGAMGWGVAGAARTGVVAAWLWALGCCGWLCC